MARASAIEKNRCSEDEQDFPRRNCNGLRLIDESTRKLLQIERKRKGEEKNRINGRDILVTTIKFIRKSVGKVSSNDYEHRRGMMIEIERCE